MENGKVLDADRLLVQYATMQEPSRIKRLVLEAEEGPGHLWLPLP